MPLSWTCWLENLPIDLDFTNCFDASVMNLLTWEPTYRSRFYKQLRCLCHELVDLRLTFLPGWDRNRHVITHKTECHQWGMQKQGKQLSSLVLVWKIIDLNEFIILILLHTVKPVHEVSSVKQSPVIKCHYFLSCHIIFHMNWTSFKMSSVLIGHFFFVPKVTS